MRRIHLFDVTALILVVAFGTPASGQTGDAPSKKVMDAYTQLVLQLDLDQKPENHKQAAGWCRSQKWMDRAAFHETAYGRFQFKLQAGKLGDPPSLAELKKLVDLAAKNFLVADWKEAHGRWLDAEVRDRRSKLKEGDVQGLKKILDWLSKEGGRCAEGNLVAQRILEESPKDEKAHGYLGEIRDVSGWGKAEDVMVNQGGLKDTKVREEIHKQLEALRPKEAVLFAPYPCTGFDRVVFQGSGYAPCWRVKGEGEENPGTMMIRIPDDYSPSRSWPLLVTLHNAQTGLSSMDPAESSIASWAQPVCKDLPFVVVAPRARDDSTEAWSRKENLLLVIDSIQRACRIVNVDRRRIYLSGYKYGAGGAARLAGIVPEAFAAVDLREGYFWTEHVPQNLRGKSYLVTDPVGNDDDGRKMKEAELMMILRKAEALVTQESSSSYSVALQKSSKYLEKCANGISPDLELLRRMIEETVKE